MEVAATRNVSKMKGTATMSDTKVTSGSVTATSGGAGNGGSGGSSSGTPFNGAAETVEPLTNVAPLAAAKFEVNAAIDGLLTGPYSRVGVARLRDAIDLLRAAIPSRPPARGRRA
jgi:hypothetical protein